MDSTPLRSTCTDASTLVRRRSLRQPDREGSIQPGGQGYQLELNDPPNSEHGGERGLRPRVWTIEGTDTSNGAASILSLVSPDGDQGYPGELSVRLTYTLTNDDELRIEYSATTSATTVLNLTHHSYWCFAGAGADALCARLCIEADAYTPVDASLIPTGELRPVEGTVFDFRMPQVIASRIRDGSDPQLIIGRGYDHNFVLRGANRQVAAGRAARGPTLGAGARAADDRARSSALHRQFSVRRGPGQGSAAVSAGRWDRARDPAFPGLSQPSAIPEHHSRPGRVWTSTTIYRFLTASFSDIAKSDVGITRPAGGGIIPGQLWPPARMNST